MIVAAVPQGVQLGGQVGEVERDTVRLLRAGGDLDQPGPFGSLGATANSAGWDVVRQVGRGQRCVGGDPGLIGALRRTERPRAWAYWT